MIKFMNMKVVPTDKDGGFALVEKHDFSAEIKQILQNRSMYKPIQATGSTIAEEVMAELCYVCEKWSWKLPLEAAEISSLIARIKEPWKHRAERWVAYLKVNLKSHKEAGRVKMRGIHAASLSPNEAAMKFITAMIKPALREAKHILTLPAGNT